MNENYRIQQAKNVFHDDDIEEDFIGSMDETDGAPAPLSGITLKARNFAFHAEPHVQSQFFNKASVLPHNSVSDTTNVHQCSQYQSHTSDIIDSGFQSHVQSGLFSRTEAVPCENISSLGSLGSLGSGFTRLDISNENSQTIQLKEVKPSCENDNRNSELHKDTDLNHSCRFDSDEGYRSAHSSFNSTRSSITEKHVSIELQQIPEDSDSCTPDDDLTLQNEEGDTVLHVALIEEDIALFNRGLGAVTHYSVLNLHNLQLQTPLHLAVIQNLPHVARRLVAYGAAIDARDRAGNTPLHMACARSRMECVLALTTHLEPHNVKDVPYNVPYQRLPQNQNILNYDGKTCLHLAAENGHFQIVSHLLNKCGADINAKEGKAGETILHQAIQANNPRLVEKLLLFRHCDVNIRRYDGATPYQLAYGLGLLRMQKLLLRAGASDYLEAETEEMMDMETSGDIGAEPVPHSSPRRSPLIPRTPPREDEFVYDDIKIGGELVS